MAGKPWKSTSLLEVGYLNFLEYAKNVCSKLQPQYLARYLTQLKEMLSRYEKEQI